MFPVSFDRETGYFDPPRDMPADECEPLPVYVGKMTDGRRVIISCFKMTPEELAEVNRTGRVWLIVQGRDMPVVSIDGLDPFK